MSSLPPDPDELILDTGTSETLDLGGWGGDLLIEVETTSGLHWTDFREYRRGRCPGDWTERWVEGGDSIIEGAWCDLPHRNVLQLNGSSVLPVRSALSWNAPESDVGLNDQESYTIIRPLIAVSNSFGAISTLRGSGTTGSENCYRVVLFDNGVWWLSKLLNGANTILASTVGTFVSGGIYKIRFGAVGTTIRAKVWAYGDSEPASWVSVVDPDLSAGWIGFQLSQSVTTRSEVLFFSVATNNQTAPNENEIDTPLDTWIHEDADEIDLSIRVEYYNPNTDQVEEEWISLQRYSHTTPSDYPSSTILKPLLIDPGSFTSKLEADAHLGGASIPIPSPIRLNNRPVEPGGAGPFDAWSNYSFYGRPIEVRMGKKWRVRPIGPEPGFLNPHRTYEIIGCALLTLEPEINNDTGEVILTTGSPTKFLSEKIPVYKNIGISTGVKSLGAGGYIVIPSSTSYDLTNFSIYLRVFIPSAGVTGSGTVALSKRETDATHRQWFIGLHQASHSSAHSILVQSWDSTGTQIIGFTSDPFNVNRFVDIVFAVKSLDRWYVLIDGSRVWGGVLTANPVLSSGITVNLLQGTGTGLIICDHRIEGWVTEDEAISRYSVRKEPDQINISMHRCDDGSGNTATDYNTSTANHGTLQGTDGVDRSWIATYLGSAELAGSSMPFSGGVLYHAPTQAIDSVREGFRYNDRDKTNGAALQIRAKGLLLTGGGVSYSEPAEGPGTADIVGASDQPVTYGLTSSSTPETEEIHVPRLIRDELLNRDALDVSTCDVDSFSGLRKLLPFKGGFHYSEPPIVSEFLSNLLGSIGSHFLVDSSARVAGNCFLPPINPGPYGQEGLLEFLGIPNRGVTFPAHSAFDLNQTLSIGRPWFGIAAWIKPSIARWQDPSSSLGTYLPSGMTIIDRVYGASGYYLGIDGRDGSIIFGAPGVTSTTTGLHYLSYYYPFIQGRSYFISAYQDFNTRQILVYDGDDPILANNGSKSELTDNAMTVPTDAPLRIGHGPLGSFHGWIGYVIGSSSGLTTSDWIDTAGADQFNIKNSRWNQANVSSTRWNQTRYLINLTEGRGDAAIETKNALEGIIEGTRWCPKLTLDFRKVADPNLAGLRKLAPAWRTEGRYKQNREILSGANVAAGVSNADRVSLGLPYLSEPDARGDIRDNYLNSKDITIQTPLLTQADADSVASLIRCRIGFNKRFSDAKDWYREMIKLILTDEVLVYDDRALSSGRAMRVFTLAARLNELRGDVGIWG